MPVLRENADASCSGKIPEPSAEEHARAGPAAVERPPARNSVQHPGRRGRGFSFRGRLCGYGSCGHRSAQPRGARSEEHTSELQSLAYLVCRLLLEKKKNTQTVELSILARPD